MREKNEPKGFKLTKTKKMVFVNYDSGTREWGSLEVIDWNDKKFWPSPRSIGLNYGVDAFEGLKAFRHKDGRVYIFRLSDHAKRFRRSVTGIIMPGFPEDKFIEATERLVKENIKFVPEYRKGSLYIRPICYGGDGLGFSFDPEIGFTTAFWCSPVGEYLPSEGISVWVAKIPRAVEGGLGSFKIASNYAITRAIKEKAKDEGCDDALFLDEKGKFIQELTAANIFVVPKKYLDYSKTAIWTPLLKDTILAGITRASIMTLAKNMGFRVKEKDITVKELLKADEIFCCGTAAIVTPIRQIKWKGRVYAIGEGKQEITKLFYNRLTEIQYGDRHDVRGWLTKI